MLIYFPFQFDVCVNFVGGNMRQIFHNFNKIVTAFP